jgi:hypothetical protein
MPRQLYTQQYFQGITSLRLGTLHDADSSMQLPAPTALPALRQLTVDRVAPAAQAGLWASVGPYMRQLVSLTIDEQPWCSRGYDPHVPGGMPQWFRLFSAATVSETLTHLDLHVCLEPWLVKLLQQHTPKLQQLTVLRVGNEHSHGSGVAAVFSWRTLRTRDPSSFSPAAWGWLPLPADGRTLTVEHLPSAKHALCEIHVDLGDLSHVSSCTESSV